VERMAEPYREPQPAQAAPDLASEEWPDLNGSSVNGNTGGQAGGDGMFRLAWDLSMHQDC